MVTASLSTGNREVDGSSKASRAKGVYCIGGRTFIASLLGVATLALFASASAYAAGFVPPLGAAAPYAILGVSPGTNTGLSNITGDLGLTLSTSTSAGASSSPASSGSGLLGSGLLSGVGTLAGSLLGSVNGATIVSRAAASVAEGAAASAYQAVANETPTHVISGSVPNGATLTPGVYTVSGPLELVGRLLLSARGAASPDFIFQIPSNLTTAPGARVLLGAGVQASNVLWQVGGVSALSPGTSFVGTILSNGPITLGLGSELLGRALSLTGDVNLDSDSISVPPVGAVVDAAANAAASATKLAARATGVADVPATPRVHAGALVALPLTTLHPLTMLTQTLTNVSTVGSSTSGNGSVAVPAALPFIPLSAIGVPELEIPNVPTVGAALPSSGAVAPLTNVFFPLTGIGAGLPTSMVPMLQVPGVPSSGTSAPTSGATAPIGLPTLPLAGLPTPSSIPLSLIGLPSLTAPTSTSAPAGTPSPPGISLPALTLPSSVPSGVVLPGVTAPSNSASSAPASNPLPLPLPLSGISLPRLSSPSSALSLPALTLPTLTTPGVALPRLSSGSSTATSPGKLVHPQVKGSPSTNHLASTSHAKSSTSSASAKGSKMPVGAPQTGFGGAAGASLDLALLAFVLALCAASFAIRTRRLQRG